jgi:hypothetical protein
VIAPILKGHTAILWVAFILDVKVRRCGLPVPPHERNLTAALRANVNICEAAWADACNSLPATRLKNLAKMTLESLLAPGKVDSLIKGQ